MLITVGFTGTQRGMTEKQKIGLYEWMLLADDEIEFHHGDCIGADAEAHDIVYAFGYAIHIHPPLDPSKRAWKEGAQVTYLTYPYLERNKHIVRKCEMLIAAPATNYEIVRSGTWMTVRYARSLHRPIVVLQP